MKIFTTVNPETLSNIYLVSDDEQKNGVLIDPGSFSANVYKLIKYMGVEITKIILTHNDIEQTGGIPLIKKIYDPVIYAKADSVLDYKTVPVKNGSVITAGSLKFSIIETPVHTYDSISILTQDTLFVGDIFQAGILNAFDERPEPTIYEFEIVKNHILSLPDNVIIYPGKGPATTIEIERKFNPYFKKFLNVQEQR
jgi:hydroxyacylglutathione hydrolase